MSGAVCTAPKRGHKPGSDQWRDCPACSAVPKDKWVASLPTLKTVRRGSPVEVEAPDLDELNVSQRKELASDPTTDPDILSDLICLGEPETVRVFANPNAKPDDLAHFASTASGRELMAIASNPNTPNYALMNIYRDHSGSLALREAVASNPGLDQDEIVKILMTKDANHTRAHIYVKAASNPALDADSLYQVCTKANYSGSLPTGTVTALLSHPNVQERHFLALTSQWREGVVKEALDHPKFPVSAMWELATGPEAQSGTVLGRLARKHNVPDEILNALASEDQLPYVIESAKESIFERLDRRLGIDAANEEAMEYIFEHADWMTVTDDDPVVFIAKTMFQDKEK